MEQSTKKQDELVSFLRKRDYKLVKELGEGACGKTVLLHDDQIDQHFVCKKYAPYYPFERDTLFANFIREIKLLYQIHHHNVVRVFNYYLYPDQYAGYILMEYIDGADIDDYVKIHPGQVNDLFLQAISGFAHLEQSGILHRDVRPQNVMVSAAGALKIIDLGFGKRIERSEDFDKSISLNWWCEAPVEFDEKRYDFRTEVYFVGKLFERIVQENELDHFKHADVLRKMCHRDPSSRTGSFAEVEKSIKNRQFTELEFTEPELTAYRWFADAICNQIVKISKDTKYITDIDHIQAQLSEVYRGFMLEDDVPDAAVVLRCIVAGTYYYRRAGLPVRVVRDFIALLKSSTHEKKRVILANLHTKLDSRPRYSEEYDGDDGIPF